MSEEPDNLPSLGIYALILKQAMEDIAQGITYGILDHDYNIKPGVVVNTRELNKSGVSSADVVDAVKFFWDGRGEQCHELMAQAGSRGLICYDFYKRTIPKLAAGMATGVRRKTFQSIHRAGLSGAWQKTLEYKATNRSHV